jgi:hypothetical protein
MTAAYLDRGACNIRTPCNCIVAPVWLTVLVWRIHGLKGLVFTCVHKPTCCTLPHTSEA